ncbi:uncharacterized protein [Musca autumnalis]|uniref:uncharacterized protein n=1 Tax=Musca autumnalis TaxID=221902 RepID=UPI003CF6D7BE
MSITLDVNAFLNKDVCTPNNRGGAGKNSNGSDDTIGNNGNESISMEKEMETTNIFEEIEHLLKFNKNLEFPNVPTKDDEKKAKTKKSEEPKPPESSFNHLDFLSHTDDFLLASETQSLLGEDSLLFSVEQDRLQPLSSKFMVPGIYKRIEGVDVQDLNRKPEHKLNVFITDLERTGRIIREQEFQSLYELGDIQQHNPIRKLLTAETVNDNDINCDNKEEELSNKVSEEEDKGVMSNDNVPKEMDNLHRLACDIYKLAKRDHIVIDRNNNEIVRTHHSTNQKTIYRFCQPDMLDLLSLDGDLKESPNNNESNTKEKKNVKLGRPRKRLKEDADLSCISNKSLKEESSMKILENEQKPPVVKPIPHSRTRSGRLVRIPSIRLEGASEISSKTSNEESLPSLLNDLRDTSYHNSKIDAAIHKSPSKTLSTVTETDSTIDDNPPATPPKRKVPPEAICPTCHKIFLGKRLQRHFAQHPDHIKLPTVPTPPPSLTDNQQSPINNHVSDSTQPSGKSADNEDISLFRFLVNKLQRSQNLNEDQKADLFLAELNDLVEQLQLRSSRLIRNTSGLHFVSQKCSKLLSIPEGQYALDMTAIESPIEPDQQDNNNSHNLTTSASTLPNNLSTRSLDYTNLSITLDDTLTDEAAQKLNLSAGGKLLPPSEESLLRAVDDLVQTDISKIQTTAVCVSDTSLVSSNTNTTSVVANLLPPHIDHVSDNAVEAVHMKETLPNVVVSSTSENPLLDLSVDFFQFNN